MTERRSTQSVLDVNGTTLGPPKGSITITQDAEGKFVALPDPGLLDRNIQIMQWSLVAPAGYLFAAEGITFREETGFTKWPGLPPVRENDWQIRANVNRRISHGDPSERYKYDFHIVHPNGQTLHGTVDFNIDPDMENQPQP